MAQTKKLISLRIDLDILKKIQRSARDRKVSETINELLRSQLDLQPKRGGGGKSRSLITKRAAPRARKEKPATALSAQEPNRGAPTAKKVSGQCPRCGGNLKGWGPLMKRCENCEENFSPQQLQAVLQ